MILAAVSMRTCPRHGQYSRKDTFECPVCRTEQEATAERRRRTERILQLTESATIPVRFAAKGFAKYIPKTQAQTVAREACEAFAEAIFERVEAGSCVTLIGPQGVGKTHLLVALVAQAVARLVGARYITQMDFLAAIKGNWAWHGAEEVAQGLITVPLLALDEMLTPAHESDRQALFELVDARYRALRATLVASNLSWPQMRVAFGERLCDRLLENGGKVISLDGTSQRCQIAGITKEIQHGNQA